MRVHTLVPTFLVCFSALGCSGPVSVEGTVAGRTLEGVDAFAFSESKESGSSLILSIADHEAVCATAQRNAKKANTISVTVALLKPADPTGITTIPPGTYTVVNEAGGETPPESGAFALAYFQATDGACESSLAYADSAGAGGTVTLTAVTATEVEGSFDSIFPNGGSVSGEFIAPFCSGGSSSNAAVCEP